MEIFLTHKNLEKSWLNEFENTLTDDTKVNFKPIPNESYGAAEWIIPGMFGVFILKPFLDAFLKEAGKDSYNCLKTAILKLARKSKEEKHMLMQSRGNNKNIIKVIFLPSHQKALTEINNTLEELSKDNFEIIYSSEKEKYVFFKFIIAEDNIKFEFLFFPEYSVNEFDEMLCKIPLFLKSEEFIKSVKKADHFQEKISQEKKSILLGKITKRVIYSFENNKWAIAKNWKA